MSLVLQTGVVGKWNDGADTDRVRLGSNTRVANSDVLIACDLLTGCVPHGNVQVAGFVVQERCPPVARIMTSGCIAEERTVTSGSVARPSCVESERLTSRRRVAVAFCVVIKRGTPSGGV